jgi:hypothetical protein
MYKQWSKLDSSTQTLTAKVFLNKNTTCDLNQSFLWIRCLVLSATQVLSTSEWCKKIHMSNNDFKVQEVLEVRTITVLPVTYKNKSKMLQPFLNFFA